jgi:hypothetical protein
MFAKTRRESSRFVSGLEYERDTIAGEEVRLAAAEVHLGVRPTEGSGLSNWIGSRANKRSIFDSPVRAEFGSVGFPKMIEVSENPPLAWGEGGGSSNPSAPIRETSGRTVVYSYPR